jgi:hypothetical protein
MRAGCLLAGHAAEAKVRATRSMMVIEGEGLNPTCELSCTNAARMRPSLRNGPGLGA